MKPNPYQRLPGRGRTWTGPSTVWIAPDHVLLVLGHGFYESYRRFFLEDIQAIIVRRTHTGKIYNSLWLFGLFFFGLLVAGVSDPTGRIILLCVAAPFAVGLITNLLLGPTCACHIRTAVQTERVPAVSRWRTAGKFISRLTPLITATQGHLSEESISRLAALQGPPAQPSTPTAAAAPPPSVQP
jgi:hypothetical protein